MFLYSFIYLHIYVFMLTHLPNIMNINYILNSVLNLGLFFKNYIKVGAVFLLKTELLE
jgi:hypothetical protein